MRRARKLSTAQIGASRKERFRRFMAERGIMLEYARKPFQFHWTTYLPDFEDPASGVYYQVVASGANLSILRLKLDLMRLAFPFVQLKAVRPNGADVSLRRRGFGERTIAQDPGTA